MIKKGFTIIEVLVVVAVLTILVVLVLVNVSSVRVQSRDRVRIADIQEIRLAVEEYRTRCGEYPSGLGDATNNGCPAGTTMGDFLAQVPENPDYVNEPEYYADNLYNVANTYNGYMYAGLTSSLGGKCFDYHVGVPLESGPGTEGYLSEDHDCAEVTLLSEPYTRVCPSSENDFDNAQNDQQYGVYDLRSAQNC